MNRELIPEKEDDQNDDDPFKRVNAYGLMKKKEEEPQKSYFESGVIPPEGHKEQEASHDFGHMQVKKIRKHKKKMKSKLQEQAKNRGKFLESKQMVFTDLQMLVPSIKPAEVPFSYPDPPENLRNDTSNDNLQPVLQNKYVSFLLTLL